MRIRHPGPLLAVEQLAISVDTRQRTGALVREVSFSVARGESFALVGESGSGKTLTLKAMIGLLPMGIGVTRGAIQFEGHDLVQFAEKAWREIRGRGIAMVFQDPMVALNPLMTIGDQIAESVRSRYEGANRREARTEAVRLLGEVGIERPEDRARALPHELSGGMRQRAMIAIALGGMPKIILCDEPTTALDVTVQHQVLAMLKFQIESRGLSLVYVSHDLAVVSQICSSVAVMYAGEVVEYGTTADVIGRPSHPYTQALVSAVPTIDRRNHRLAVLPPATSDPLDRLGGCALADRCPVAESLCTQVLPKLQEVGPRGHNSACLVDEPSRGDKFAGEGSSASAKAAG